MNDYILFMHAVKPDGERDGGPDEWGEYFAKLKKAGAFEGGSSIGDGICASKGGSETEVTRHITGYIRIRASSLDDALELVIGNPVFESGGTVEIRELPKT